MTSAVEHKHCAIENTTVIIMAARENSSSSEKFYPMKTARMNVICTTVMLVKCQKSELVHFALSHAEFGVICTNAA